MRELATIVADIRAALKSDTANVIRLGGLLAEAKVQVRHGEWLPWLEREFSLSESTAQRYLQVHRFLKSCTVRDLNAAANLAPSALYALAEKKRNSVFTEAAIAAIFEEAAHKRVSEDRALKIAWSLQPQTVEEIEAAILAEGAAEAEQEAAEQAEADAILDGPPPDPSPSPAEAPVTVRELSLLSQFARGVQLLHDIMTKPAFKFVHVDASPRKLEQVADFLRQVANLKAGKVAA